jgi:TP901-1 family phage major tail protein
MAAQKGKDLLVKINTSGSTFTTIGGLRSTSISINDEPVDVTNKDSANARTLLATAGTSSMTISGSGVFVDDAAIQLVRGSLANGAFKSFNLVVPDLGTYAGSFMIASLEFAGEFNGEVTYSLTLESSGAITFS